MDIDDQAEILAGRVRRYLIGAMGRWMEDASDFEIYEALSFALREEIMINWSATARTNLKYRARRIYYVSMEYLPGRLLASNLINLKSVTLVAKTLRRLGKNPQQILSIEKEPALGNGGLGRFASCLLEALATQRYPAMGYGLRYQYGIFEQQLWEGDQIEKPDCWLLNGNPWEYRRDGKAKIVKFGGIFKKWTNSFGQEVLDLEQYEEIRALPFDFPVIGYASGHDYHVLPLRLWSTKESPHNFHLQRYNAGQIGPAAENTAITDVLYPSDYHETGKRIRIKQEFLLVSATLQDIFHRHLAIFSDFSNFADKVRIQINDTHPAMIIAEMMRLLIKEYRFSWMKAWETTQEVVSYTNHTILSEALEQWDQEQLKALLPRQYWVIEQLNEMLCAQVRKGFPKDETKVNAVSILEKGKVRMAHLAAFGSHRVNGVSKLHGKILKERIFPVFNEMWPEKFTYVTNGVNHRHWLGYANPLLSEWLNHKIGHGWMEDFSTIHQLKKFADDPQAQDEFLAIKRKNKLSLIKWISENQVRRNSVGKELFEKVDLQVDALFDVQAKRFHEYKRQLMNALHLIILYQELKENPQSHAISRVSIFSGKAAPGYEMAKNIIHLIDCLSRIINRDSTIQGKLKIVFIENYAVTQAEQMIPAADLSEQISTAGLEASGTGNMKLAMNGALTIGTADGSNIEMREAIGDEWWVFGFGSSAEELEQLRHKNRYNPWDIYHSHLAIKKALDALRGNQFVQSQRDQMALSAIYDALLLENSHGPDRYFVLKDLPAYIEMQKKVEKLFQNSRQWAKTAMHHMAGMGGFSADHAAEKYAKEIWGLHKCPIESETLQTVKKEYADQLDIPQPIALS